MNAASLGGFGPALAYALGGALVQALTIFIAKRHDVTFLWLLPLIATHQFFFLSAYTKAPSFTVIWFLTSAIANLCAVALGWLAFGDGLSATKWLGIALIILGAALTRL